MPGASVTYERAGLLRYIDKLTGAPDRIARRGAEEIVKRAKPLARVETGYMRDHIEAEPVSRGAWQAVSQAPYSGYNEYGTYKMSAQPFMTPAAEAVRAEFANIAVEELKP